MSCVALPAGSDAAVVSPIVIGLSEKRGTIPKEADQSSDRCSTDTQSSLIRRVQNTSDEESWNDFVTKYRPMLVNLARSRGLSFEDNDCPVKLCETVNQGWYDLFLHSQSVLLGNARNHDLAFLTFRSNLYTKPLVGQEKCHETT